jgi:acetate kinase
MKVILAINAGSSSLKISAYSAESRNDTSPKEMASAQISGLSAPPRKLTYSRFGQSVHKDKEMGGENASLGNAFNLLIETLIADEELREISSREDIAIACHRVVHGGDYETAQLITKNTYHHIEKLSDLAPLHNSAALGIINSCVKELRTAANIACFDTQFHTSIPSHISTYPIDQDIAQKNRLRKYGFHGISYAFIARSVAQFLDKPQEKLNIIALHLGSGASACAIKDGKSWDTSMGLTPLAGLPGATRSGSVDPRYVL